MMPYWRGKISFILSAVLVSLPIIADENSVVTADRSRDAYNQPVSGLSEAQRVDFLRGRSLVRQSWVIPPSENPEIAGLGPLYNRISCVACHPGNGRGFSPDGPDETMRSMLVRLSVPGHGPHGEPVPVPAYGDQLNEHGAPGVPGEGLAQVRFSEYPVRLGDGETVMLRKPALQFTELAYGPLPADFMASARIGPALNGLGLLEAVPESELMALEKAAKPAGIRGRMNRVWDHAQGKTVAGRFGWKANMPSLRQQIAGALVGDMSITTSMFPHDSCMPTQQACLQAASFGATEASDKSLSQLEFYHLALAVPQAASLPTHGGERLRRGAGLFREAYCAVCHVPTLKTGSFEKFPRIAHQTIAPYTDLLLHDMGEALADHRPDFMASGREWRTPPLWGIGLAKKVEPRAGFLHDGRARTLEEAILWHGGEAEVSSQAFIHMPKQDRDALVEYLNAI